jgi:LCP family protein required for cell wall assembly
MKRAACVTLCLLCLAAGWGMAAGEAETYPVHPLIRPDFLEEPLRTSDRFFNLLLLGVDYGETGYRGSGFKAALEDCHTDAVIVLAVNMDAGAVSMVSIPRDTLVYVPGVRGIYKFNGAINCAPSFEQGLLTACRTAGRVLGGIEIHAYCAVDFGTMIAIGDAIGGVDFELDMSYSHLNRTYRKGMQHLDGLGIADYLRARTNATRNANDIGRTGRQRDLLKAVFEKVLSDLSVINDLTALLAEPETRFFTNANTGQLLQLAYMLISRGFDTVGTYVIDGRYLQGMRSWNFTFTDPQSRRDVIREVWGAEVGDIPYISKKYTDWLYSTGFKALRAITVSETVLNACAAPSDTVQEAALALLQTAYTEACEWFTRASFTQASADIRSLNTSVTALRKAADAAAKQFGYTGYQFSTGKYWYADEMINAYQIDWR